MTDGRTKALRDECLRQEESCLYTSAGLYTWQKWAALWRVIFLIAPVILGGIAGSQAFGDYWGSGGKAFTIFSGLLAGFFPAIYVSLNLDMRVAEIARSAGEFTNLRDRFRRAAEVTSLASYDEFSAEFETLMDRMDSARMAAPPAPEWCFREAQKKIKRGDHKWDSVSRGAAS